MLVDKSITTEGVREETWSVLEALAREGARKLLQQTLENEVVSRQSFLPNRARSIFHLSPKT